LLLGGLVVAARAPLARGLDWAAGLMLAFLVFLYPFHFPWYSMAPLSLQAANVDTRPRRLAFVVTALWGALLMLQYTSVHRVGTP
jgi:hypothetical protein